MQVHPKAHCLIFFAMGQFDWSFTKNHNTLIPPNITIFYQYGIMVVLFQGISWIHILLHLIGWVELLFLTLFITIFGLNFYKSLSTYCDSLINYIIYGASQSTNVIIIICNGSFGWPFSKNIMKSPPQSKLFYTI